MSSPSQLKGIHEKNVCMHARMKKKEYLIG